MKLPHIAFISIYLINAAFSELPRLETQDNPTNLIRVAGQEFPLLFETPDISDALMDAIIHDVELNLSHIEHITLQINISNEPEDSDQSSHLTATHLLDEGRQERFFPDVYEKYFGGVILSNGVASIIIRSELIKEYERALDFKAQNLAMFDRLDEFLSRLRSKEFLKAIENDSEVAQNTFFFDRPPGKGYNYANELSGFLKTVTIRDPSILDFSPQTYGEKEGVLCLTLITWKDTSLDPVLKGFPQFVYIDGEWRLYMPYLP